MATDECLESTLVDTDLDGRVCRSQFGEGESSRHDGGALNRTACLNECLDTVPFGDADGSRSTLSERVEYHIYGHGDDRYEGHRGSDAKVPRHHAIPTVEFGFGTGSAHSTDG